MFQQNLIHDCPRCFNVEFCTNKVDCKKPDTHTHSSNASFIDAQCQRYRGQLERYQKTIAALHPEDEIRCALYFTGIPHLEVLKI